MSDGAVHQMSMLVGQLKEAVEGVKMRLDSFDRLGAERENAAVAGRRVLHEKMDSLSHDFVRTEAVVENLSREVATVIKPAVETFQAERNEGVGAARLGKKLWLGGLALASAIGGGVSEVFHRLLH